MRRFYFFIILIVSSSLGCALFESFDELPMFIEVNAVQLTTTGPQGSSSNKILDIWPNTDGQSRGVFEMPITYQVLDDDNTTNMIYFAGIRRAGIANDHTIYPFYDQITFDREFVPDTRIVEDLTFEYRDNTRFRLVEDFEFSHAFTLDVDENEETEMIASNVGGLQGNCGLVSLTEENNEFIVGTSGLIEELPINGTAVYVEMDYKSDIDLTVGLQAEVNGTEATQFFIVLTPKPEWNKVYIDISQILQDSGLDAYRLLLGGRYDGNDSAEVRVDNIKLLHF